MKRNLACIVVLLIGTAVHALERGASGLYGGKILIVGVDARKSQVSGYFSEPPCSFFFAGNLTNQGYAVTVRDLSDPSNKSFPGLVNHGEFQGRLGFNFKVKDIRSIGSCGNAAPYLSRGDFLPRDSDGDWVGIRVVSAKQASLFQAPGKNRLRSYVVQGDVVKIYRTLEGWVEAEYDVTRGWISETDLYPVQLLEVSKP